MTDPKGGKRNKIKKFSLNFFLIVLRATSLFIFILGKTIRVIWAPVRKAVRFVFYKAVVKGYCFYLSILKKLGWDKFKGHFLSFLFNQRTVHFVVAGLVIVILFFNFTSGTQAMVAANRAPEAMISRLVTGEFDEFGQGEELIVETASQGGQRRFVNRKYDEDTLSIRNRPSIVTTTPESRETETSAGSMIPESGTVEESEKERKVDPEAAEREEIITYTVQSGDTIGSIASRFDISVDTILWENDLSSYDVIRAGDELRILPVSGVVHEVSSGETLSYIANRYDVDEETIMEANDMADVSRLSVGQKLMIPGGEMPETETEEESSQATEETTRQEERETGASAIKDIVTQERESTPSASPEKMHWPTDGHNISQYYSWRHSGLDIANRTGTPIYSAETGTVEYVGWTRGYGNNVIINHGGGRKTRYAHLSAFSSAQGDRVTKGEVIGDMGNTGWSTGPHLHFEVIINGRKLNPLNYIR